MKNWELVSELSKLDPNAEVVIHLDPTADDWVILSVPSLVFITDDDGDYIAINDCEVVSRSSDWDEHHPGWPEGGTVISSDVINWSPDGME
jgi:hypothetical protein